MVWFKVDDTLAMHTKVLAAGNPAMGLWVRAGSWSAQQLSDGFVPTSVAKTLGNASQARALVSAGLWHQEDGGYRFHEWDQDGRQPTRSDVEAKRKAQSDGVAQANHRRWHVARGVASGDCQWCTTESVTDQSTDHSTESLRNPPDPARPDPTTKGSRSSSGTPRNARDQDEPPPHPNPDPEPEFQNVGALLQAAGLPQHQIHDFLIDLKASGAKSTAAVVNKLHQQGKLPTRITEWRNEHNLATEAAARPKPGAKPTTDDKVRSGFDISRRFEELENGPDNVTQFPKRIERA